MRDNPKPATVEGSRSPRVAGIVLAGGSSRRMGNVNKLLVPLAGTPTIVHTVQALVAAELDPLIVVTGHDATRVETVVGAGLTVFNADHADGMGTSVATGVRALPPDIDGFLICPGDMPWVQPRTITLLIDALADGGPRSICVPVCGGQRGNPVLFGRAHRDEVSHCEGDRGARDLLHTHAARVVTVDVDDTGVVRDIDTPADLARASENPPRREGPSR